MKVAVFGSGPAGLLVAHAAAQFDAEVDVFSEGKKSELYGAQYLHQPIPGIPDIPYSRIEHHFVGTIEGYKGKVYGTEWDGVVSPEQFSGDQYVWDIRYAYNWLWEQYRPRLVPQVISGHRLMGVEDGFGPMHRLNSEYDMVFSTIPRPVLCVNPDHKFKSAKIYCAGDAPDLGIAAPIRSSPDTVTCSGDKVHSWYRLSNIFDHTTVEWAAAGRKKPPLSGVTEVRKPTTNTCTCWPELQYEGRYGQWKKGVLVHHAFRNAVLKLQNWIRREAER